ncbi:nicotinate-nucleotide--dimethylbenzimidazole phosphoribosyltransferase [Denitratisoma oestradiolicum]|uniref:Nicotinate-nucleotide--dimethylbenzimidazole phosphoribosyltransferase n=1 Tax=Denitratisoma oestradiolicum TaxID=311182 RepID=A0A6S6XY66_9PROT|nr:nicotinate-nucleotide--dimethylbenzimidazole phosphoribosyltransferase [Denitratisoma oestradiolicum]TWO81133.1 nicotinate-nucleotide--dimethylbenzimidazole phosphoribosyltransferase [Denitratisoma oestradiolicum]CAB1367819.1 Nicotinate-nucleotide--dimethylbenzimidazole phosphoribosyltransferase [Denitratisoma oestradiolicum]
MHSPALPRADLARLDTGLDAALQHKIDNKTKPPGALGRLEALALQLGRLQNTLSPQVSAPHMLVFAGDHGAARAGVSAYPQEVTWQMVENFLAGGAAINVFARQLGWTLQVVDAGVAHDFGPRPGLVDAKIAAGTANYLEGPAMRPDQCQAALARGAALARQAAAAGSNLLACGEMGIGNTASASLLTHYLAPAPLELCIGRGTGLDDNGLMRKKDLLGAAVARYPGATDPLSILAHFGGFEITMMVGAMLAAAEAKMLIVADGFIVTAALLVAARLQPALPDYCVFAHRSGEPGHQLQLDALGARPLLDLGLRLGEGTGAALALPLIQAAANFLEQMASFESAGVAEKT